MKEIKKTIYKIEGRETGPTLSIFCGIHGNETAGIKAVKKNIRNIKIKKGILYLIIANEKAIDIKKREDKYNMNRMFGVVFNDKKTINSYEYRRVKKLEKILDESDALLDLHSSGTKESVPFLIFEKPSEKVARKINFPIKTSGWYKIQKGSTDEYMFSKNKTAICAECGFHNDPRGLQYAENAIFDFLQYFKVLETPYKKTTNKQLNLSVKYSYITQENFSLIKTFSDFEDVRKNQIIGIDGGKEISVQCDGKILFARDRNKSSEEAFILLSNKS